MAFPIIYEFEKTSQYLRAYVDALPTQEKRGAYNRLAHAAQIFPSYLSQIFKNDRHFNLDQAQGIANHLGLSQPERRYLYRMIDRERATRDGLRNEITDEMRDLRLRYQQIEAKVPYEQIDLNPEDLQTFYSAWHYIAVRLLTSIPEFKTKEAISSKLNIPIDITEQILRFLIETRLCVEEQKGYNVGPTHMHIDHKSPLVQNHHANWRLRSMEKHPFLKAELELAYSFVATLSKKDALKIRNQILKLICEIRELSDPSEPETAYFLNIDWLGV